MGILGRLLVKTSSFGWSDWPTGFSRFFGGARTHAGVTVTESSAMRQITVYSCARVLAETLASLPLVVYRKRKGGGQDVAWDHPTYPLLHDAPNDEMASSTWRETTMGNLVLSGNCYSVLQHNRRGQVIDIYPVDWHLVRPHRHPETQKLQYGIMDRGKEEIFPAEQILHIPLWGDGIIGYSPIRMAAEAIGVGMAASEFVARFYGQGMNVGGLLEHPSALSDKAYERLKEWIETDWAGLENSWKPMILEEGMKFSRIPMPLREVQFVEMLQLTDVQVCGLFRVPPHMVGRLERATFNNIEHLSLDFVKYSLLPYITRYEQNLNRRIFTQREREEGYYVKFNVEGLLRGDYKSRQEGLQIQRQNGVINANEWRELEEYNPIEGPSGDAYLVNGNMISIERALAQEEDTSEGPDDPPQSPTAPRREVITSEKQG